MSAVSISNVTKAFRANVFDYEKMISDLSEKDFKKEITEGLRKAGKQALVTLTSETIGALTDHFDLVLEAEAPEATAGAGQAG